MKVAVKDANVLIDLVEGDLLGLWFRLGIETHVPDLVLEEIKNPEQRRIVLAMVEAGNLKVGTFDATQVLRIGFYKRVYRVSLADAAAILLADVSDGAKTDETCRFEIQLPRKLNGSSIRDRLVGCRRES